MQTFTGYVIGAAIALSVLLDIHSYRDSNEDFAGMEFRPSWKVV